MRQHVGPRSPSFFSCSRWPRAERAVLLFFGEAGRARELLAATARNVATLSRILQSSPRRGGRAGLDDSGRPAQRRQHQPGGWHQGPRPRPVQPSRREAARAPAPSVGPARVMPSASASTWGRVCRPPLHWRAGRAPSPRPTRHAHWFVAGRLCGLCGIKASERGGPHVLPGLPSSVQSAVGLLLK